MFLSVKDMSLEMSLTLTNKVKLEFKFVNLTCKVMTIINQG